MKLTICQLKDLIHEGLLQPKGIGAMTGGYFNVGDEILFGKWKNKRGVIVALDIDERGVPIVVIEPRSNAKGRKKNVEIGLYKIWRSVTE